VIPALVLAGCIALALIVAWWLRRSHRPAPLPPFPRAWHRLFERRLPHYMRLSPVQRGLLQQRVQVFLRDKRFHGCNGLEVSEEMRVLIAGLACLLILRPDAHVYPRCSAVLLYPEAFWVRHAEPDELGLVDDDPDLQIGESWRGDRVILSWADVEAALTGDAVNVVAHEFAHQLDDENPGSEGAPRLPDYARWSKVMQAAFDELCERGSEVIDDYGSAGPAEFFAVVVEAYFQRGTELRRDHAPVYQVMRDYFGVETA
jgi:Mlc titration factor MtfA (ptsG expression regulator)